MDVERNPYEFSTTNSADRDVEGVPDFVKPILKAKGWLKFLGVVSIVMAVLYTLATLGIGLVITWIPFWLGMLLLKISSLFESGDEDDLKIAFDKLRLVFKIVGIYTIVGFALGILGVIAAIIFPALMMEFNQMQP